MTRGRTRRIVVEVVTSPGSGKRCDDSCPLYGYVHSVLSECTAFGPLEEAADGWHKRHPECLAAEVTE